MDLGFDTGSGSIYLIDGGYFYSGSEVANNSSFVGSLSGEWAVHEVNFRDRAKAGNGQ